MNKLYHLNGDAASNIKKMNALPFMIIPYLLAHKISFSKYPSTQNYYQYYFLKYRNDGFNFKINKWYNINIPALIFGPLFYMYNGLYLGLAFCLLLDSIIMNIIYQIIYAYELMLPNYYLVFTTHIIWGFFANYFMMMKFYSNIKKAHNNNKNNDEASLLMNIEKYNIKYRFINLLLMTFYMMFMSYVVIYLNRPEYLIEPINSFNEINRIIMQDIHVHQLKQ